MKNTCLILLLFIAFSCCKKDDDDPINPIDQLPPATQTGAYTFGCLLDGEAFLPSGGINPLDCVYQYVNGGYYFSLQGNKRDVDNNSILLGVSTKDLQINEGQTYSLVENSPSNAYGTYGLEGILSHTNSIQTGELTITKLDTQNQIVSGTFWFDIIDFQGTLHEIREGRFDMLYTQ